MVVEQHEIDIGTRRHLAAAEPAEAEHHETAARHAPVRAAELGFDALDQRFQNRVGERREGPAGRLALDRARQKPDADQEALFGGEDAQPRQALFEELSIAQKGRQSLAQKIARRNLAVEGRVQQGVEDMRAQRDGVGQARRGGDRQRQKLQKTRIGGDQREELKAGRQALQEAVKTGQRIVGVLPLAEGFEQ